MAAAAGVQQHPEMENVEVNAFASPGKFLEIGNSNDQDPSNGNLEDPLDVHNTISQENVVNDIPNEYPSVVRRTVIVTGVALALFCVSHRCHCCRGKLLNYTV